MLQIFEYEGSPIQFEVIDGKAMANATLMATANNKKIADYLRLKATSNYMDAVEKRYGDSHNEMITVKQGGQEQGTWIIDKLVIDLARWLSPDFAVWCDEKLAELSRNGVVSLPKSQFIEFSVPVTFSEALRLAADQQQQLEEQGRLLEIAQPKVEFYDAVTGSSDTIDIGTVSKVLAFNGMGRTKLFEFLRDQKVLMKNNIPYQYYQDAGWFRVIESNYNKPDGSSHVNFKTVVFQKGIDGIRKLLISKGK